MILSDRRGNWTGPVITSWIVATLGIAILFLKQWPGLWSSYVDHPEHGHALLIPIVVAYLVWQRRNRLSATPFDGTWLAIPLVVLGVVLRHLGVLTSAWTLVQLGLVVVTCGLVIAFVGTRATRVIAVPLLFALFAVPLPDTLLQELSSKLQLLSSVIGVSLIKACNISVHLDGNIIDLGSMKLQVAEACSGLKYLLSLLVLAFIMAYFFVAPMWMKVLMFISAVPVTVFMNSVRIAVTGITVEFFGRSAAEGFLHDFEGLVIFLGALVLLTAEMTLLAKLRGTKWKGTPLIEFGVQAAPGSLSRVLPARPPAAFYGAIALVVVGAAAPAIVPKPERAPLPDRRSFDSFPMTLDTWIGERQSMQKEHLDLLRPDDYLMATYASRGDLPVNAHVQYFESQSRYRSTHSPRVCIPGAGWEIERIEERTLPEVLHKGQPLRVARATIVKGESSMLVYFWFEQRGHVTVNEYETKLRLVYDSLRHGRTDGALVRLITPSSKEDRDKGADARLQGFARAFVDQLPMYLTN